MYIDEELTQIIPNSCSILCIILHLFIVLFLITDLVRFIIEQNSYELVI